MAVIRATAPVISRHVAEIVNIFYHIFFSRHPEMRSLFSLSHRSFEDMDRDLSGSSLGSGGRTPPNASSHASCPVRKSNTRMNVSGTQARAMAHTICAYCSQLAEPDSGFEEVFYY
jgi:hemoglobin-like flavoprotein